MMYTKSKYLKIEVNIIMKNKYLNFSNRRSKAGFLAILLISATAVTPAKAGWFSDTVSYFFSSLFSDTDSKGPIIALAAVFAAGIGTFAVYSYFKNKKNTDQNTTTDDQSETTEEESETNSDKESDKETSKEQDEQIDTEQPDEEENKKEITVVQINNVPSQYDKRIKDDGTKGIVTGNLSCGYHATLNSDHILKILMTNKIKKFPGVEERSKTYGALDNSIAFDNNNISIREWIVNKRKDYALTKEIILAIDQIVKISTTNKDSTTNKNDDEFLFNCLKKPKQKVARKLVEELNNNNESIIIDGKKIKQMLSKHGGWNNFDNFTYLESITFDPNQKYELLKENQKEKYPEYKTIVIKKLNNENGEFLFADELVEIVQRLCKKNKFCGNKDNYTIIEDVGIFG